MEKVLTIVMIIICALLIAMNLVALMVADDADVKTARLSAVMGWFCCAIWVLKSLN